MSQFEILDCLRTLEVNQMSKEFTEMRQSHEHFINTFPFRLDLLKQLIQLHFTQFMQIKYVYM